MAKPDPTRTADLHPDARARFERAVDVVAKSPPQHRTKAKTKARKSSSKRKAMKKSGGG
jgi:hypothetical protein